MDNLIENMTEFLGPAASGVLGNALIGLAILIIGLFVVKIISGIVGRLLGAGARQRAEDEAVHRALHVGQGWQHRRRLLHQQLDEPASLLPVRIVSRCMAHPHPPLA